MDAQTFEIVRGTARETAPDAYASALLAPYGSREDLIVLAAFVGDVDRIVASVSDPALAEIRLQWWRDAISGSRQGTLTGSPVADALAGVIGRRSLPVLLFEQHLEARADDLYADPVAGEAELLSYLEAADAAPLRLAARCIPRADPEALLYAAAGEAAGRVRLLITQARWQARGRRPFPGAPENCAALVAAELPAAHRALAAARAAWRSASEADRRACLSLGTLPAYLAALQRPGHDPARFIAEISPLSRLWRVWVARRFARV